MTSKQRKPVLLHYASYFSVLDRNTSSKGSLKHDGKKYYPKRGIKLNLKLQNKCTAILVWLVFASFKCQHCCENFSITEKSAQIACWNQMYMSLEITEFTLFLGCIYCA